MAKKNGIMTNDELLHKWVNNSITEGELEIFRHRPEYLGLTQLYRNTQLQSPELDKQAVLKKILSTPKNINTEQDDHAIHKDMKLKPNKKSSLFYWISAGVAACFLLFTGYQFGQSLGSDNVVSYEIADNQSLEGVMPDESIFVLRNVSKLSYLSSDWEKHRIIDLDGIADFSVKKGSKFSVNTANGIVEVLGTQFTVESKGDVLKVYCKEGKVSVIFFESDTKIILTMNESMEAHKSGRFLISKKDISSFRDVTLTTVISALEKQFKVNFITEGIDLNESLSCNFQHSKLDQALITTLTPLAIKFEVLPNGNVRLFR